jgi:uncharacterized protein YecT (DUF1311 family)
LAATIISALICSGDTIVGAATQHGEAAASVVDVSMRKHGSDGDEREMVACVVAEYKAANLKLNRLYGQIKEQQ